MRISAVFLVAWILACNAAYAGGLIFGTVTDKAGHVLEGVRVVALAPPADVLGPQKPIAVDTVLTGANGKYLFDSLERPAKDGDSATYHLEFTKTGYHRSNTSYLVLKLGLSIVSDKSLEPIHSLSIRVLDNESSATIPGARIGLGPRDSRLMYGLEAADPQGWARFEDLEKGMKSLTVTGPGYETLFLQRTVHDFSGSDSLYVAMRKSETDSLFAISGTLASASGKPIDGDTVLFREGNTVDPMLFFAITADGKFAIAGIPPGIKGGTLFAKGAGGNLTLAGKETVVTLVVGSPLIVSPPIGIREEVRGGKGAARSVKAHPVSGSGALLPDPSGALHDALGRPPLLR